MDPSTLLLAYTGDLETSCVLAWLVEKGFQVSVFVSDVSRSKDDLHAVQEKALAAGAKKAFFVELTREVVTEWLYPAIQANCSYEDICRLGESFTHPAISRSMIEIADSEGCEFVSHGYINDGPTAASFDRALGGLKHDLKIIAPWEIPEFREKFQNRQALVDYAEQKHISIPEIPDKHNTASPTDAPQRVDITFANGVPVELAVEADRVLTKREGPVSIFHALNDLARNHRIGDGHFPGIAILCLAHAAIEDLVLNNNVREIRNKLSGESLRIVDSGELFAPQWTFVRSAIEQSQRPVSGVVSLILHKGEVVVEHCRGNKIPDVLPPTALWPTVANPPKLVKNAIGIIGGMGPQAGLDLFRKVIDQTIAGEDQEHLPVILVSFPNLIVDRTDFMLGKANINPAYVLADIARKLDEGGAAVCAMSCNSAHAPAIFETVVSELCRTGHRIRLLSILNETARFVRQDLHGVRRVGVLSTLGSHRLGLYADALRAQGLEPVLPDDAVAACVHTEAIYGAEGIKAKANPVGAAARAIVIDAIMHLRSRGAQAVILGCTELPLAVTEREIAGLPVVDPTLAIARALIYETQPRKLKLLPEARKGLGNAN